MPEEISTPEGVSQDQNLGKPADAETINGEQDKTTPDNPPKQDDAPNKETSAPVKTASDFARERIMRRQLKELESKKTDDDDDDVSPEDAELVEKVVGKRYGDRFDDMDKRIIAEDVNKAIDKSEYKEFMSQAEIDKVHKLSLDPKYSQVPFDSLIIMSLAGRMPEIGAELARKASEKINETKLPSSNASQGGERKDVSQMSDAEYAEYRKSIPGVQ